MRRPGVSTTRVSFAVNTFRVEGSYKCACGKKYKRARSAEWTENPFHPWQGREKELNKKALNEAREKLKAQECPGCGAANDPVSTC